MKSKKETSNKASISYSNQRLTDLAPISNNVPIERIDLSGNPIVDFKGMKTFPELHTIDCSNTRLTSFNYFPNQEGIKSFICKKTPLCTYQFLNLMCTIVFGQSLESVNGISINQNTKSNALTLTPKIRPFLVKGWTIQNLTPVKIIHTQTRQRKTFFINFDQHEDSELDTTLNNSNSNINDNEGDQDIYLEYDSESDVDMPSTTQPENADSINNEEGVQIETEDKKEENNDDEVDERLRERFMRLQESVLLEMKRPDIIPTVIKGGRVTVLSSYPSRANSSLSSRQSANSHPRAQTTLKNYSKVTRESDKKT